MGVTCLIHGHTDSMFWDKMFPMKVTTNNIVNISSDILGSDSFGTLHISATSLFLRLLKISSALSLSIADRLYV